MLFNKHLEIRGQHALFSPSSTSWLRYDEEKILEKIISVDRAPIGTEIHEYAANEILLNHKAENATRRLKWGIESFIYSKYLTLEKKDGKNYISYADKMIKTMEYLPPEVWDTVKQYINDAVGYKMTPEQPLLYCEVVFGTADAISFRNGILRVHDLKTGAQPGKMEQLEIYAALTCLEYKLKPFEIEMELRIYQNGEVLVHRPTVEDILPIMDQITTIGKLYKNTKKETE